jgi:beta-lactamase regulating signal transducer with metallopeptidase domain/HEAT repeat protein
MLTATIEALRHLTDLIQPVHPVILLLIKITLVLILALAATAALERASAGARYLVWLIALAALLVLPPVAVWAPLPLPVLPAGEQLSGGVVPGNVASGVEVSGLQASGAEASKGEAAEAVAAPAATTSPGSAALAAPGLWTVLFFVWGLGAVLLLLRLGHGAWSVHRVVRRARPLDDPSWQTPLYEIADRLGLDAAPRLLQSDQVKMPFAAGLWSSTIVLPAESEQWSAERRSAVLIHELGHVRRRDLLGHTLSRLACALYWFHPLVWTAARRLRAESERACDDLALVFGARPSDYAEHLLDIVTCVRDHNTPAIALAMAHRREFEGRMLAILNPDLSRKGPSRAQAASGVVALAGLALLVGAAAPVPREAPLSRQIEPPTAVRHDAEPADSPEVVPLAARLATSPASRNRPSEPPSRRAAEPPSTAEPPSRQAAEPSSAAEPPSRRAAEPPSGDRIGTLARTLRTDPSAEVRRIAAWGLENYARNDTATAALVWALQNDADAGVREMSAWALSNGKRGGPAAAAIARAIRQDKSAEVRQTAVWAAGEIGDASLVEALAPVLSDSDVKLREVAAWSIGQCGPKQAPAALIKALGDADAGVRLSVAWALYELEDPAAAPAVEAAFIKEAEREVQLGLLRALGSMGDASIEALEKLVSSSDPEIRRVAVAALAGGSVTGPWPWPRPRPRPSP